MNFLTANPLWMLEDILVLMLTVIACFNIIKHDSQPVSALMEMLSFTFVYALVYENFATLVGLYQYGRSVLMVGNVPLAVGLLEWLTIYAALRLLSAARVPVWITPFIVGLFGMLQDATIDPVAVRQVAGGIGRWTWREGPDWSLYLGIPAYNFSGWFFLTAFSSAMLLIGRSVHKRTGYSVLVGYLYPIVAMIVALVLQTGPWMRAFLWLSTRPEFGAPREWSALALWALVGTISLLVWRWRMRRPLSWSKDWPVIIIPTVLHFSDIVFALIGQYRGVLANELVFTAIHLGIIGAAFYRSANYSSIERTTVDRARVSEAIL